MIFTGELLEHLARWTVFLRVDELFILVPMIGNLKGNLEMCLSARLGTSANIGELDNRKTRKALLKANMSLLALQALSIASLAAVISFALGLMTRHRLGDIDGVVPGDNGAGLEQEELHEGYTRPGLAQLVMVLATGMGSAGLSSAILGSFMSSMIVVSRWFGIDPGESHLYTLHTRRGADDRQHNCTRGNLPRRSPYSIHPGTTWLFIGRSNGYSNSIDRRHLDGFGGSMVHQSSNAR